MKTENLLNKAQNNNFLSREEGLFLYENAATPDLMYVANEIRKKEIADNKVTWLIDMNVNITNICMIGCKFCNFHRSPNHKETYITSIDEYKTKIEQLKELGGNQFLLQGGIHPKLGIKFYTDLFKELKAIYPQLKLHALGPPEIVHISKMEQMSYEKVLSELVETGLDSLPGAGAEILSDRVRKIVSPAKCNSDEWLDVMRVAHKMKLITSATMMFGHIETKAERIEHLIKIRDVQAEKPIDVEGFIAFIPWTFQDDNTNLKLKKNIQNSVKADEYIRTIAISRILLRNIKNIQASWLTVGKEIGQICLSAGANDFGSIMIEENVVSSAGANYKFDANSIKQAIKNAGFIPQLRNQKYEYLS